MNQDCAPENSLEPAEPSITSRVIVFLTTGLLVFTAPWTLQAFVPEPYFLRSWYQLRVMSTPNGFGQIERSLSPFLVTLSLEIAVLLITAVLAWRFRNIIVATIYLMAVIGMAVITLWRLIEGFQGLT
jgi:hypothetical protein